MSYRVMIFSPEERDRKAIEDLTATWMLERFPKRYSEIDLEKFNYLRDAYDQGKTIGDGREILVVFDRRLKPRSFGYREGIRQGFERVQFEMTERICEEKRIPTIIYEGEIEKGEIGEFELKLRGIEAKVSEKINSAN